MFKAISLIALIAFLVCLLTDEQLDSFQSSKKVENSNTKKEKKSTSAMPADAVEQYMRMTANPALNRRTPENLLKISRQVKSGYYKLSKKADINTWEERGPNNVAGRTRALLIDQNDPSGNTVWAGSVSGGLWKTTNFLSDETTWSPINDFFQNIAVSSLAQDPSNPDVMYFGTGEGWFNLDAVRGLGIWKTEDGGESWDQLPQTNNSGFSYIQKIVVDTDGSVYACTRSDGVQKSPNGGATWIKVLGSFEGGAFSDRAADIEIAANGDLYASLGIFSSDGIYKSTNGGNTWTGLMDAAPNNGLPDEGFQRIELATAPSNADVVYALFQGEGNDECMGIYRTDNGGDSWTSLPVPSTSTEDNFTRNQAWYDLIAQVDPIVASTVYIGGIDLLRSKDGGETWTPVSHWFGNESLPYVHADQHSIQFYPGDNLRAIVGNDGGIFALEIDPEKGSSSAYCPVDHRGFFRDYITSVELNSISNTSGESTAEEVEGYSDYTDISTSLSVGSTYTLSFTTNFSLIDSKAGAWIDWSNDGIFDPGEQILMASGANPYQASFTVPQDAAHGSTRLRVRMQYGPDYLPDPCAFSGFLTGETEDYTIVIDNCGEGNRCNDGDNCTINDMLDADCNCVGTFFDENEDGFCDFLPTPDFAAKNANYNVTQFYSCAIHPEAGSNIIIGGTQDNGTQQFTEPGLNSTSTVSGGDGGFCFIDQDQPNIQISTYIYNNFHITTDNWESSLDVSIGENAGYFINPMDYDSELNTLYSSFESGYLARIKEVGTQNIADTIHVEELEALSISALKVDPHVVNRVWVATEKERANGGFDNTARLIAIDNANSSEPVVSEVLRITDDHFRGRAYTRNIEICPVAPKRMITLFSNFGVPNLWLTDDGGDEWVNVDGNLPDMPVYWVMFDPLSKAGAIIATEMGIWTTDILDGSDTHWEVMNQGLANVRIDMLTYRPSDQTLVAATHGRGIFTTTLSSSCPSLNIEADIIHVSCAGEADGSITLEDPSLNYTWSTGAEGPRIEHLKKGTYHVTISPGDDCHYFKAYTVESASNMEIAELIIKDVSCPGDEDGAIAISVAGGVGDLMYQWNNGLITPVIDGLASGEYTVTVTDENNCAYIATATVSNIDTLKVNVSQVSIDQALASPGGGTPPYSYQWSDASEQTSQLANDLDQGSYTVTVTDANNCQTTGTIEILELIGHSTDLWDVISSAGQTFTNGDLQIDWTLGESFVDQRVNSAMQLSEGFHQLLDEDIVTPQLPDLEVVSFELQKDIFFSGEFVFQAATIIIRNNGSVPSPGDVAAIYLSEDATINFGDEFAGIVSLGSLDSGQSDTLLVSISIEADVDMGDYFLLFCLDEFDFIDELSEVNNCGSLPITISGESERPDLIISEMEFRYDAYFPGDRAVVDFQLVNIGNTTAVSSFARHSIYVSPDLTLSLDERVRSIFTFEDLFPDQPIGGNVLVSFGADLAPGEYYVVGEADSDNRIVESNENNNFNLRVITIRDTMMVPDLTIQNSVVSNDPIVGAPLESTTTISNIGDFDMIESILGVYLTKEDTLDSEGLRIGAIEIPGITAGQSIQIATSFEIPDTLVAGEWNVIYAADAFFWRFESNEENNTFLISDVTIGGTAGAASRSLVKDKISLFPNPTTGNTFVQRDNNINYTYEIVLPNGQRLANGLLLDDNELPTSQLIHGVYYVILKDEIGKREVLPFIKL